MHESFQYLLITFSLVVAVIGSFPPVVFAVRQHVANQDEITVLILAYCEFRLKQQAPENRVWQESKENPQISQIA